MQKHTVCHLQALNHHATCSYNLQKATLFVKNAGKSSRILSTHADNVLCNKPHLVLWVLIISSHKPRPDKLIVCLYSYAMTRGEWVSTWVYFEGRFSLSLNSVSFSLFHLYFIETVEEKIFRLMPYRDVKVVRTVFQSCTFISFLNKI